MMMTARCLCNIFFGHHAWVTFMLIQKKMVALCRNALLELLSMLRSNDSRVFRYLRIYMMMGTEGNDDVFQALDSKDLLTPPVVFTAWETGRLDILKNCLTKGVPIEARRSVTSAIRSGSVDAVDFCEEQGGSVRDLERPYCHCTTTAMMEYIWDEYKCKLYDRDCVFPRDLDMSLKYMEMGGTVAQMGKEMNDLCRGEGNWRRSLPIKRAYLGLGVQGPFESSLANLVLALPKCLVNQVCQFV
ncbi:unnamed protein product [Ectocarpus sp. 12 AP-2014]